MFIGEAQDLLKEEVVGSFGNFKTQESQEIYYLMATLRLEQIELLHTASESMDFGNVSFEEMVQRDIDYERVDNKIIKEYLQNGKDRVIFFPPLLASLMSFEGGDPIPQYEEIADGITEKVEGKPQYYFKKWGDSYFKLELPLTDSVDTGYSIYCEKEQQSYNFYNYAGKIKYNPNSTKLVVIDGQHRLSALKRIKDKSLLNGLKIPVCIFFSPNIVQGKTEKAKDSMRELFVTINNTSKEVGGHFLTLLNDSSLSAITVRMLAGHWKGIVDPINYLHFIEWNQRESKLSFQRTRRYSITTVSVVDTALSKYVYSDKSISTLMNLQSISDELEEYGDSMISIDSFEKSQLPILKEQIDRYIIPAIHTLFTEVTPYQVHIDQVSVAYRKLVNKVENNVHGAETYLNTVLMQFRSTTKYDDENVRDIEKAFLEDIPEKDEHESFYFRNVFQRGLIKAWSHLVCELSIEYELSPENIANALKNSLNSGIMKSKKSLFDNRHSYIQHSLFVGARILVKEQAIAQISNLIVCSILKGQGFVDFVETLIEGSTSTKDQLTQRVMEVIDGCKTDYLEAHADNIRNKLKKDFRFMGLNDRDVAEMEVLDRKGRSGDRESQKAFLQKIDKQVIEEKEKAQQDLDAVLNSKK